MGTTGHYFHINNKTPIFNEQPTDKPLQITVSNGESIYSPHEATLRVTNLPPEASKVHLFPNMTVVDNFGIKYTSQSDAEHLIAAIQDRYECTIDWDGALYCGILLKWDYIKRRVRLSMPNYVKNALIT